MNIAVARTLNFATFGCPPTTKSDHLYLLNSVIGAAMLIAAQQDFSLGHDVQMGSETCPASYPACTKVIFSEGSGWGMYHSPPSSAKVKNTYFTVS